MPFEFKDTPLEGVKIIQPRCLKTNGVFLWKVIKKATLPLKGTKLNPAFPANL